MKLLLLVVFVIFQCVNSFQVPSFDILPQRYQVQPSSKGNDFLYRQLLNRKDGEDDESYGDNEDDDPLSSRYGFNSEEFNDINYNIQNDESDDDEEESNESSSEVSADVRQEESESHSSLVAGHQYVSGGAGEGKQHLQPDGSVPNKEEIKTDADLPAYCDPPNPCPHGYKGEDCDSTRLFSEYTADFSKAYQEQQFCMCDDDHNECQKSPSAASRAKQMDQINDLIQNIQSNSNVKENLSPVVAKKSPRIRRDLTKVVGARGHLLGDRLVRVAKKRAPTN